MTTPTDLVVVLPGILGSTLRHRGRLVWSPTAGSVLRMVTTLGRCVQDLAVPDDLGDEHPGDGVEPVDLMPDVHVVPGIWTPVKGYDRLLARLRSLGYREPVDDPEAAPGNLLPVAYDWRLSNRYNGRRLAGIIEPALQRWREQGGPYANARVVFVCHSMGGLVARWYVEHCGGAELTRKVITFGTPYRGSAKALEQLVNGVHPGVGRCGVDLTRLVRSMPSMYQLLPEYACVEHGGDLAKTTEVDLPDVDSAKVADGMRFHTQLAEAECGRPASLAATHAIVGVRQATGTTARLADGRITLLATYRGEDLFGDATVPIVAAGRADVPMDSPLLRRVPDQHGNLHRNTAALDELDGVLTASPVTVRAPHSVDLRVQVPDLIIAGEDLRVRVAVAADGRHPVRVTVTDENHRMVDSRIARPTGGDEGTLTTVEGLAPGAYAVDVTGLAASSPVSPVSTDVLVWGQ